MILVAGSANLDFVVRAAAHSGAGRDRARARFQDVPGGKGANQAIACARAGGSQRRRCCSRSATIRFAAPHRGVAARGRSAACMSCGRRPADRHRVHLRVGQRGERDHGRAGREQRAARRTLAAARRACTHLLMQLETPIETVIAYARAAQRRGVQVVLNAAPARTLPEELLTLLDVLVVNKGELATVAGMRAASRNACERIDVPCVVVTLGERGCCARDRRRADHARRVRRHAGRHDGRRRHVLRRAGRRAEPGPDACRRHCAAPTRPARWPARSSARSRASRRTPSSRISWLKPCLIASRPR